VDGRVVFADCGNFSSILLNELARPIADGSETLHNEGLVLHADSKSTLVCESFHVQQFTSGIVDAETSALSAALDTSLLNVLSSAAAFCVDVLFTSYLHIGVLDPSHHLLVSTHVRSQTVNCSSNKAFFDKLHGVLACDSL